MSSIFTDAFEAYGDGRLAPNGSLRDAELGRKLQRYRRNVAKSYRICEPENVDRYVAEGKLWLSPKVDGQLWFIIKRQGEVALCSYNGRVLQGVPVVDEAKTLLEDSEELIAAGELFALPPKGEARARVQHVSSALGKPELGKTLGFKVFDLLEEGEQDWQQRPYLERLARFETLFAKGKRVAAIATVESDRSGLAGHYQDWVQSGKFEGLVARSEQGFIWKVKPTMSIDAVVIAFGERVVEGVEQLRELSVALLREDDSFQLIGTVGNGFSEQDRVKWLERLRPLETQSSFRMANREGTLCRFVRPELVVEIKLSDLVESDASEVPNRRMRLSYDPDSGYRAEGLMPVPSMLFPIFLRQREDKKVDQGCVGLDQLLRHLAIEASQEQDRVEALANATILRREVYAKAGKGGTAVRKFVAFATNKSEVDERYPPYVVFFTDYSGSRKTPLETELRVASCVERVDALIADWHAANIKKGWNKVSP
ncbi:MAG: hypothetical protein RBU37_08300 [Myxococcota bacterium]|jgi:hypothetical protein|nr:hypothetical protein [Myxococcota bacterium]